MKTFKLTLTIFFLAVAITACAQTNPSAFNKIKITGATKSNGATRMVVQDSITKEYHWVLKSSLVSPTTPTLQQVATAGSSVTFPAETDGIYSTINDTDGAKSAIRGTAYNIGTGVTGTNQNNGVGVSGYSSEGIGGFFQNNVQDGTEAFVATTNNYTNPSVGNKYIARFTNNINTHAYVTQDAYFKGTGFKTNTGTSSQFLKADGSVDSNQYQTVIANPITGTGTTNYLPKFTGTSTLGNSSINEVSSRVLLGATDNTVDKLQVNGSGLFNGSLTINSFADYGLKLKNPSTTASAIGGNYRFNVFDDLGLIIQELNTSDEFQRNLLTFCKNSGNILINTTTDNTVDKLQVNGSILGTTVKAPLVTSTTDLLTLTAGGTEVTLDDTNSTLTVNGIVNGTSFVVPAGTSSEFLKADGSVDSNVYALASATPDLQQVLDTGNSTFNKQFRLGGVDVADQLADYSNYGVTLSGVTDVNGVVDTAGFTNNGAAFQQNNNFGASLVRFTSYSNGLIKTTMPDGASSLDYFLDIPIKSGMLATTSDLAGTYTTEAAQTGIVFFNNPRANYGNIGIDAVDFSYSGSASSTFGATGENAFNTGIDNISSNFLSTTFGFLNDNSAIGGFTTGFNSKNVGYTNFITGVGHDVTGMNMTVVGQASNVITQSILTHNEATAPVFVVGNGTITDADPDYGVATRSDALIVRKNGVVEAPSQSIAEIDAGTDNTLATKAYVKKIEVRKINTATTLADSDNGTVILLTASCTVTLPNGLSDGFNCSFTTQAGATLTYSLGGSVTLINNSATTMPPISTHTIVNTGTANEYLTVGL